jgi:hypothetical protein
MGITASLGVNISDSIDIISLDTLTDDINWDFLTQTNKKLEIFGGNHVLKATKELLEEILEQIYFKFFTSRLCFVYYGLTDEEIQVVIFSLFINL